MDKQNVMKSLKNFHVLSKLSGLFPYSLDKELKFEFSFVWFIYATVLNCYLIYTIYITLSMGKVPDALEEIWRVVNILRAIILLIQSIIQICKSSDLVNLLYSIKKFDDFAKKFGIFMDYQEEKWKSTLMSLTMIFPLTFGVYSAISPIFIGVNFLGHDGNYELQMNSGYVIFVSGFFIIQFSVLLWIVKKRFEKINDYLKFILKSQNIDDIKIIGKIKRFLELHHMMMQILKKFNNSVAANIALSLIAIIVNKIFTLYGLIFMFWKGNEESFIYKVSLSGTWMMFHVIFSVMICYSGDSLTKTAEKSEDLIREKIITSKNLLMAEKLRLYLIDLKLVDKNVQNSFVVINWKLFVVVCIFNFIAQMMINF